MAKCKLIRSSIPAKITGEIIHLAWINNSPSSAFAGQQIDLDTPTDYEFTRTLFLVGDRIASVDTPKGYGGVVSFAGTSGSSAQNINYCREFNYVSDTKLQFLDGYTQYSGSNRSTDNSSIKPLYVYTYKKDLTATVNAIASSVKANAQNCMMSDGVTSVEDAIDDINTALGYKYKQIYNSGKFTADNTVTLTDNVTDFKFLVARTGNSSDGSSSKSFGILPSMVANMGCYLPYNKGDKFLRISASSTSFRLIECTSGEYIYQIYGVY
jgi:hypothetical protein